MAYALHFYACTHADSLRWKADTALDNGAALFITEFGLTTSDGGNKGSDNYRICSDSSTFWLDWADERKISWANWSLSNIDEASAAPGYLL
jgi:endoglucanase